ncbi:MAG: hypothetical protein IPK62_00085 [Bacteroidetes bacterium]|nr:hypothetical protein [Bacteroidota bacterium]
MKKIFFILLAFASLQCMADKKTPAEKAKEKTEELQKALGLSAEQSKKVYEVNLKGNESIEAYEAKKPSKKLKKETKRYCQRFKESGIQENIHPGPIQKV